VTGVAPVVCWQPTQPAIALVPVGQATVLAVFPATQVFEVVK
jgi:hypothetical protein